jgi:hypothetical protein
MCGSKLRRQCSADEIPGVNSPDAVAVNDPTGVSGGGGWADFPLFNAFDAEQIINSI